MSSAYLLDTHAFLWALTEPERLSNTARDHLQRSSSVLWVSSVSFFEIATKVHIGKLMVSTDVLDRWEWILSRLNARPLPLEGEDAIRAGRWASAHRDPFDRLLAAQAANHDLQFVSCDKAFEDGFEGLRVCW